MIDINKIAIARLYSQQLVQSQNKTVKDTVARMGAMQAQDFAMSLWAVGCRLPHSTLQIVQKAFDDGDILRTHVMRPTWHLVSSDDIYWMLQLTAPQIKATTRIRDIGLGIDEKLFTTTNTILEKALDGGKQLTADELKMEFTNAKIDIDDNRFYHYMMRAEIEGIVCSAALKNKKHTYALLSERTKKTQTLTRDEALANLAKRYFTSHAPACLKDFVWWSGLSVTDARKGLEAIKHEFHSEKIGTESYFFTDIQSKSQNKNYQFLPAFDELVISYKIRDAVLSKEQQSKVFTSNGIFRPFITFNGHGCGTWKRTIKKDSVLIETMFFDTLENFEETRIYETAARFGSFLELTYKISLSVNTL